MFHEEGPRRARIVKEYIFVFQHYDNPPPGAKDLCNLADRVFIITHTMHPQIRPKALQRQRTQTTCYKPHRPRPRRYMLQNTVYK